jgi:hypothetical protein
MNGEGDMSVKDHSTIMLFGKKIPVQEYHIPATSQKGCQIQPNSTTMVNTHLFTNIPPNTIFVIFIYFFI